MLLLLCCKYPNLGELKPNAFFALLVKTEKTAFIVGTDSLQYFSETSTTLNKKNTPANVRGCKP